MKPIQIGRHTYTSIIAAWRDRSPEGLTLSAVRWRLREGWSDERALTVPTIPPRLRRTSGWFYEQGI